MAYLQKTIYSGYTEKPVEWLAVCTGSNQEERWFSKMPSLYTDDINSVTDGVCVCVHAWLHWSDICETCCEDDKACRRDMLLLSIQCPLASISVHWRPSSVHWRPSVSVSAGVHPVSTGVHQCPLASIQCPLAYISVC